MYMNTREIEVLLEKYYEGDTSLNEEKLLRDFFSTKEVPAHLKSHQALFAFFNEQQRQEIGAAGSGKKVFLQPTEQSSEEQVAAISPNRRRFLYIAGIAATVLLLISMFFTLQYDIFKNKNVPLISGKTELAYNQASEALLVVSSGLNTGLIQVSRLKAVDKAMKNMQLFHKFYQYQPIIINPDEKQNQSIKSK